ncbi:hypothetical protein TNCV_761501 [Trichonephila clavipes]|nr:hypothetical protein TNCV_761501 [Trichonephila clavipes]
MSSAAEETKEGSAPCFSMYPFPPRINLECGVQEGPSPGAGLGVLGRGVSFSLFPRGSSWLHSTFMKLPFIKKLTVWCALWAGGIIGPYFFKNDEVHNVTVNGDRYRAMITNFFISELNNHDVQGCGPNKTAQHVTQLMPQSIY